MALSEVFPYGAPELLDGAPARMARSTMTASLAVALLVAVAGAMLPRTVTVAFEPTIYPTPPWVDMNIIDPSEDAGPPVEPAKFAKDATPVLVPDVLEKKDVVEPAFTDVGPPGEYRSNVEPGDRFQTRAGIDPPHTPAWNEFVPVDEFPALVRCKEAIYPDLARSAGVEGTVRVLMLVGLNGHVERAIIAPKGSIPMLDQAALDAALTCVFTPALANGHPVKVWVSQNYRFSLHSAP